MLGFGDRQIIANKKRKSNNHYTATYSQRVIGDTFVDVREEEKRALICQNAVELYKLPHAPEEVRALGGIPMGYCRPTQRPWSRG